MSKGRNLGDLLLNHINLTYYISYQSCLDCFFFLAFFCDQGKLSKNSKQYISNLFELIIKFINLMEER